MLYLPRGVMMFLQHQADIGGTNLGSLLINVSVEYAKTLGFTCNHALAYQVIDKDRTKLANINRVDRFKKLVVIRCTNCGETWEKVA
jgi:hypothetical protein